MKESYKINVYRVVVALLPIPPRPLFLRFVMITERSLFYKVFSLGWQNSFLTIVDRREEK